MGFVIMTRRLPVLAAFALLLLAVSTPFPAAALDEAERLWLGRERSAPGGPYPRRRPPPARGRARPAGPAARARRGRAAPPRRAADPRQGAARPRRRGVGARGLSP